MSSPVEFPKIRYKPGWSFRWEAEEFGMVLFTAVMESTAPDAAPLLYQLMTMLSVSDFDLPGYVNQTIRRAIAMIEESSRKDWLLINGEKPTG